MKPRTDEMNDEEFLEYLIRDQRKYRVLHAGSGLLAGSTAAYLLSLSVVACIALASAGVCLLIVFAYLHLTAPEFVPTYIDDDTTNVEERDEWLADHPLLQGKMSDEERNRRISVLYSDLEVM